MACRVIRAGCGVMKAAGPWSSNSTTRDRVPRKREISAKRKHQCRLSANAAIAAEIPAFAGMEVFFYSPQAAEGEIPAFAGMEDIFYPPPLAGKEASARRGREDERRR